MNEIDANFVGCCFIETNMESADKYLHCHRPRQGEQLQHWRKLSFDCSESPRRIEKDWCCLLKIQRGGSPRSFWSPGARSSSFKLSFQLGEDFRTRQQRDSSIFDFGLSALLLPKLLPLPALISTKRRPISAEHASTSDSDIGSNIAPGYFITSSAGSLSLRRGFRSGFGPLTGGT